MSALVGSSSGRFFGRGGSRHFRGRSRSLVNGGLTVRFLSVESIFLRDSTARAGAFNLAGVNAFLGQNLSRYGRGMGKIAAEFLRFRLMHRGYLSFAGLVRGICDTTARRRSPASNLDAANHRPNLERFALSGHDAQGTRRLGRQFEGSLVRFQLADNFVQFYLSAILFIPGRNGHFRDRLPYRRHGHFDYFGRYGSGRFINRFRLGLFRFSLGGIHFRFRLRLLLRGRAVGRSAVRCTIGVDRCNQVADGQRVTFLRLDMQYTIGFGG